MAKAVLGVVGVLALAMSACAGRHEARPAVPPGGLLMRTATIDSVEHRFAVWVPPTYDGSRPWPCVVFLHGSGECGMDGLKQTTVGLGPAAQADPSQWACIIVMPQKPRQAMEWEEFEAGVLSALEAARREFNIDPARIALTGLSQGGHGAWVLGARHAGLWSCVVPVCGYVHPSTIAPRLAGMPVWAFHGEKDVVVPSDGTRRTVEALRREKSGQGGDVHGPEPRMTLYPDLGHNCWDKAYREEKLGEWVRGQVKQ